MDYGGAAEAAPFEGKLHAPFQSKLKLTHFADPHKWLTWGGGWAILEARAVPRLHVLGESCPDNAAGWDNRSGFTGAAFNPGALKHPLIQAMCDFQAVRPLGV